MSELLHVMGDLSGLSRATKAWRKDAIDKKAVGKLTKHLGPLQGPTTVDATLRAIEALGAAATLEVDDKKGAVKVRAVVTDHQLHDLAARLVGAFRLAGSRGAQGALWMLEATTGAPSFGHRLDVDGSGANVCLLAKKDLAAAAKVPGRRDVMALEEALAETRMEERPGATSADAPASLAEVDEDARPAYEAAWELLQTSTEAALRAAIARESAWFHPGAHLSGDLVDLAAKPSKAEILDAIYGEYEPQPDLAFRLVVWLDVKRGTAILAQAREAGAWAGGLAHAIRALVESGDADAEAEAWRLFEVSAADKRTDLNEGWHRAEGPYALAKTSVTTASLVAKLDAALAKKTLLANQKRAMGIALLLAWRTDDADAQAAVSKTIATLPDRARSLLEAYAPRNGWKAR